MTAVLMVCLGNICRSPLAEELLQSKVNVKNVKVDSAGTGDYHLGSSPDKRSIEIAKQHNLDITHIRGRQFTSEDFDRFDEIYVMDRSNYEDVIAMAHDEKDRKKVSLILEQTHPGEQKNVPDPYFGEEDGFKKVFDLLDDATTVIAKRLNSII